MVRRWYRSHMTRQLPGVCTECARIFTVEGKAKIDAYRRTGRTYCTTECRDRWVARDRSQRMSRTNRQHASARMVANNPMTRPEVREKMADTLRRNRHQPISRGGNGKPVAVPQQRLADHLGWATEVTVALGDGERPFWYNVDIAHPTMMVCVEVDGGSHYSLARQDSDRRKAERLASLGWLMFRFSNHEAMENTAECAAMVLSTTSRWRARTRT